MKAFFRIALALSLFFPLATSTQAGEEGPARVFVVHGIPGQDLGEDPSLPVDVAVDGAVVLPGFRFGQVAGPLELPAGTYRIEISLTGSGGPPVIAGDFTFGANEIASVVAHFTEDAQLTATKFENDFSRPAFLMTRLLVHHTAAAPEVDIALRRLGFFSDGAFVEDVPNGAQGQLDLLFGIYEFAINVANTDMTVIGPGRGFLLPRTAYMVYVVGSAETGSLRLIVKRVFLR